MTATPTCTSCRFNHDYRMGNDDVALCNAPQLARDPVTGQVVVSSRYVRTDPTLCGHGGQWHAVQAPLPGRGWWLRRGDRAADHPDYVSAPS